MVVMVLFAGVLVALRPTHGSKQINIDSFASLWLPTPRVLGAPGARPFPTVVEEAGEEAVDMPHPASPAIGTWWPLPCQPGKFKF